MSYLSLAATARILSKTFSLILFVTFTLRSVDLDSFSFSATISPCLVLATVSESVSPLPARHSPSNSVQVFSPCLCTKEKCLFLLGCFHELSWEISWKMGFRFCSGCWRGHPCQYYYIKFSVPHLVGWSPPPPPPPD